MRIRFNLDASGDPHIWNHNVSEEEVAEVLADPKETIRGRENSMISIGMTRAGRYLKVIYARRGRRWYIHHHRVPGASEAGSSPQATAEAETIMKTTTQGIKSTPSLNRYPKGLNRRKVQKIIDYYEKQTDAEAIAEAEAAYKNPATAMIEVPVALVPQIQKLIAKRAV